MVEEVEEILVAVIEAESKDNISTVLLRSRLKEAVSETFDSVNHRNPRQLLVAGRNNGCNVHGRADNS
eukprot:694898-Rhodomonas_salina.1